jgi:hypothetical protein
MRRAWGVVVVCVACGGSGGSPSSDGPPTVGAGPEANDHSGTRLKRRLITSPNGAAEFDGWFDSLLGVNCFFQSFPDGSSRCLSNNLDQLGTSFLDSGCTDVVFRSAAVPTTMFETRQCNAPQLWRDPVPIATPAMVFIRRFDGQCIQTGITTDTYFTATQIQPSEFVGGTIGLEPAGGELMARIRTTDDGGREYLGMTSPVADCAADRAADGVTRCAPSDRDVGDSSPEEFADGGCTQLLRRFVDGGPGCVAKIPPFRLTSADTEPICGNDPHVYAPVTAYTGPVFELLNGQCNASTQPAGISYGLVGAPIDPTTLVEETGRAIGDGGGRIRRYYSQYAGGALAPRDLFDTVNNVECEFRDDDNDLEHCVPFDYLDFEGDFADAACTQPLANSFSLCPAERRPAWARQNNGIFFRLTGDYTGTTAFKLGSGGCVETGLPSDQLLFTLDPTPVTDWQLGTRVTEP